MKLRFRLRPVTQKPLTHGTARYIENGADLRVNERHKIRHYRARSTVVVFKMRDSVPSVSYSSVCNVLRQWNILLIPTYRVYRLYDIYLYLATNINSNNEKH